MCWFELKRTRPIMNRLLPVTCAVVIFLLSSPADGKLPQQVLLVENHSDVLVPWIKTGVRGAVVVNVDEHDDCLPVTPEEAGKIRRLFAAGDVAAIERANSFSDSGLYCIGTYIAAAYTLGIAKAAVWGAPLIDKPGRLEWPMFPVRTCPLDSLPALSLQDPVLLTVDADFVNKFANYQCINLLEAVRRIAGTLRSVPWDIVHASVSFSCDGGFLPIPLRWIGKVLKEALEGKDVYSTQQAPWPILLEVENWRRSLLSSEIVRRLKPLVLQRPKDPWLRVYLADALFKSGDVPGALSEGKKAAQLDPGCCRILPELGSQLAVNGRIDEARRFIAAAPSVINVQAELELAQGLDRAGRIAEAIEHYTRSTKLVANYTTDLLIGYGYERLGEKKLALRHYLHAVGLLARPVSEMAGYANLALPVASAERFLLANGFAAQAQALRRDHRLIVYFFKDTIGTSGH